MGTLILSFPPPRNWQDFEQLSKDVAKFRLAGDFENYGRQGQQQNGIDIYGWDRNDISTGLQCKHKGHTPTSVTKIVTSITTKVIDEEVLLADSFTPKIEHFIIATTTFRSVDLQNHLNKLNDIRKRSGLFKVEIWFWETFEEEINKHSDLAYFYYEEILKKFSQYNKDLHILSLIKNAVNRPAFKTYFNSENNCEDFLKAIIDTQRVFTTGKLFDRDGNPISSAYPANMLSREEDWKIVEKIEELLQKIRDYTTKNLKNGNIQQDREWIYFNNNSENGISETLNKYRGQVLAQTNKLLKSNNLTEIKSDLIRFA